MTTVVVWKFFCFCLKEIWILYWSWIALNDLEYNKIAKKSYFYRVKNLLNEYQHEKSDFKEEHVEMDI